MISNRLTFSLASTTRLCLSKTTTTAAAGGGVLVSPFRYSSSTNNFNSNNDIKGEKNGKQQKDETTTTFHQLGVDPLKPSTPGAVRLEVQVTVMQSKLSTYEKRISEISRNLNQLQDKIEEATKENNRQVLDDKTLTAQVENYRKGISMAAAAWMSTAINLSGLLESEEGHQEENRVVLKNILEKLKLSEFQKLSSSSSSSDKKKQQETRKISEEKEEKEEDQDDFFDSHDESIKVATLLRLARAEYDLGEFSYALSRINEAISCVVEKQKVKQKKQEKQVDSSSSSSSLSSISLQLLEIPSIRFQWICLCKLKANILSALLLPSSPNNNDNKNSKSESEVVVKEEHDFLKQVAVIPEKNLDWNEIRKSEQEPQSIINDHDDAAASDEIISFLELLMMYADSLGLQADGKGWIKNPQDEIFVEKRNLLQQVSQKYSKILSPTQQFVLAARASLALDCGTVAVSREDTISILQSLIEDAEKRLYELIQIKTNKNNNNNNNNSNEQEQKNVVSLENIESEIYSLRQAVLVWRRKSALVFADKKQFDIAFKILEEVFEDCDAALGENHNESILALRCLLNVTYAIASDPEESEQRQMMRKKYKELVKVLEAREKPAAI